MTMPQFNWVRVAVYAVLAAIPVYLLIMLQGTAADNATLQVELEYAREASRRRTAVIDSLSGQLRLRADTLRAYEELNRHLAAQNRRIHQQLRRLDHEAETAVVPNHEYSGSDDDLVAAVDSIFRSRRRATGNPPD